MSASMNCTLMRNLMVLFALAASTTATADTFVLRTGAKIVGTANVAYEEGRKVYRIQSEQGIELSVPASQIADHIRQSSELAEYEQIAPAFEDTFESQWSLAEWCREHKLDRLRRHHLRRVVELNPSYAPAWRALGYVEIGGKWQTQDEIFEEKGFQFYRGKWRLAQEVEVLEEKRRTEQLEREWIARLKNLRAQLGTERQSEAVAKIRAIDDPLALAAIAEQLRRERSPILRLLYVDALAKIRSRRALDLLVATALNDPDIEVFHAATDELVGLGWSGLAKSLAPSLQDSNNARVNRSAYILGRLGDRDVVPALINALVTTHYTVLQGSGRTTATLVKGPSSGAAGSTMPMSLGGDAFSVGDRPQVFASHIRNQEVLQALVRLSGQSFGFDQRAWLNWWSLTTSRSPAAGPLR